MEQGKFAIRIGEKTLADRPDEELLSWPHLLLVPGDRVQEQAKVSGGPIAGILVLRVAVPGKNLYPLQKALEQLQGQELTVRPEVEDRTGALKARRAEPEQLLADYGIAHEWEKEPGQTG